jgi:hypothetical protein
MFVVLKFELMLIIGSNNVVTEGARKVYRGRGDRAGLDNRLTVGGKVVSPMHRPPLLSRNIFLLILVLISVRD